MTHYLLPL